MESIVYTNIIYRYGIYIFFTIFAICILINIIKAYIPIKKDINNLIKKNVSLSKIITFYTFGTIFMLIPVFGWLYVSFFYIPALPSILSKEFTTVECISKYGYPENSGGRRYYAGGRLACQDKNNKEIKINYFDNIELGEGHKLVIKYFKYIDIGYIDSIDGQDI